MIPKQHGKQPEDLELTEEVVDSRPLPPGLTTISISATNHISEQSVVTTGPSTVVASAESSTNRLAPGGSWTPSGNTPSPTLLHHTVDHTSNSVRSPIQNFTRRFIPRARALETTQNATSPQHSW